jgi:beta-lactamase regulating signal transducer with metallopeptidase domain
MIGWELIRSNSRQRYAHSLILLYARRVWTLESEYKNSGTKNIYLMDADRHEKKKLGTGLHVVILLAV